MSDALVEILDTLTLRELQLEAARVLSVYPDLNITHFKPNHDSTQFYKNVIKWYIEQCKCFPSEGGPAAGVVMLYEC